MSSTLYVPFHFIFVYVNLTIVMFITGRLRQNDAFFFWRAHIQSQKIKWPTFTSHTATTCSFGHLLRQQNSKGLDRLQISCRHISLVQCNFDHFLNCSKGSRLYTSGACPKSVQIVFENLVCSNEHNRKPAIELGQYGKCVLYASYTCADLWRPGMNLNLAVCYTDIHSKKKTLRICTATLITSLSQPFSFHDSQVHFNSTSYSDQENLNLSPMAKSIRSKAKRSFRSKKRETGVYAATEAARLHRLNSKLTSVVSTDKDERISAEDKEEGVDEMPGWCWFATLGLLDASDITSDTMSYFMTGVEEISSGRVVSWRALPFTLPIQSRMVIDVLLFYRYRRPYRDEWTRGSVALFGIIFWTPY